MNGIGRVGWTGRAGPDEGVSVGWVGVGSGEDDGDRTTGHVGWELGGCGRRRCIQRAYLSSAYCRPPRICLPGRHSSIHCSDPSSSALVASSDLAWSDGLRVRSPEIDISGLSVPAARQTDGRPDRGCTLPRTARTVTSYLLADGRSPSPLTLAAPVRARSTFHELRHYPGTRRALDPGKEAHPGRGRRLGRAGRCAERTGRV